MSKPRPARESNLPNPYQPFTNEWLLTDCLYEVDSAIKEWSGVYETKTSKEELEEVMILNLNMIHEWTGIPQKTAWERLCQAATLGDDAPLAVAQYFVLTRKLKNPKQVVPARS